MGDYFEMQRYYAPYIAARNELNHLETRIESLREQMIYSGEPEGALEELRAAEAQLPELKEKVDDLWCLYTTGHHRREFTPEAPPRKSHFGPFNPGSVKKPDWRLPK